MNVHRFTIGQSVRMNERHNWHVASDRRHVSGHRENAATG
jgi:hypothetical protein